MMLAREDEIPNHIRVLVEQASVALLDASIQCVLEVTPAD
jgi:hypothetical protein